MEKEQQKKKSVIGTSLEARRTKRKYTSFHFKQNTHSMYCVCKTSIIPHSMHKSEHCTGSVEEIYITRTETGINEEKKESGDEYVAGKRNTKEERRDTPVSLVCTVWRWE
jgi:hypothetical protein